MKKDFDCVEMKHKIQEKIYEETKDFSTEELLDYYHKAGKKFQRKIERLRKEKSEGSKKKKKKTTARK